MTPAASALLRAIEAKGITVVWLRDQLCRHDVCPASEDGVFLYRDAGHLSFEGSRWIGEHTVVAAAAARLEAAALRPRPRTPLSIAARLG